MADAGIEVVLPVYWGAPSEHAPGARMHWSFAGLPPLVKAALELIRENKQPPAIGLFYDTSTLKHNSSNVHVDLTTYRGRDWFYSSIRDFFTVIPPRLWAMIEGRPIVVLYSASFARAHDQRSIDFVKAEFPLQFGGHVPYIICEASWHVSADNVYAWGGAVRPKFLGVAEIGPGYDHSAVPGRTPLVVPREGGKFYERAWLQTIRRSSRIVILETWNEFHEGTNIAESREHGRQYINLTRKFVDLFKSNASVPVAEGPFRGAKSVQVTLDRTNREQGIKQVEHEDGQTEPALVAGQSCRQVRPGRTGWRYVYFQIDDSFKWGPMMDVVVDVDYFDGGSGDLWVHYDSNDPKAPLHGAYKDCLEKIALKGTKTWMTARFTVRQARFAASENSGADFRIAVNAADFCVRQVTVARAK
jgi:hypothetical protein